MRRILLIAPRNELPHLEELVAAWREARIVVEVDAYDAEIPDVAAAVRSSEGLDAVLLVGSARRAPATVLDGPIMSDRSSKPVPIAWLPATSAAALRRFSSTAARVHKRASHSSSLAVLGQWHPQYLRIADRMTTLVQSHAKVFRWTSDVMTRDGVVAALGTGLGLGVYVGHGRAMGWVGYHGMRSHHFDGFSGDPLGAMMSLCCRTASRRRVGLSYAESLPLRGVAASVFGATHDTLHIDNTRWAVGICDALVAGVKTVGELIVRAAPSAHKAIASYRLIGDPLAPLSASADALRKASEVTTYA